MSELFKKLRQDRDEPRYATRYSRGTVPDRDRTVTIDRDEVLKKLRSNRETHIEILQEARSNYEKNLRLAIAVVGERLCEIAAKSQDVSDFEIYPILDDIENLGRLPRSRTSSYDEMIAMLEVEFTNPVVTMTVREFRACWLDQWHWSTNFLVTCSRYCSKAEELLQAEGLYLRKRE